MRSSYHLHPNQPKTMKIHLALLSLLAVPTLAFAITRPDGTLGVNGVKAYGSYENFEYDNGYDADLAGGGIGINQNFFNGENYGFDASFEYQYLTSQNDNKYDFYEGRYYIINATIYAKGAFSPFFTAILEYDSESYYENAHNGSTLAGGAIGVECHLMPGWYVTPKLTLTTPVNTDAEDDNEIYTVYAITTGYWVTEHFNLFADVSYNDFNESHGIQTDVGFTIHY
jgi:hypothetical protein